MRLLVLKQLPLTVLCVSGAAQLVHCCICPGCSHAAHPSRFAPLQLPPGSSLPCNGFQARGVLAAVQHTLSLERCVQAVGEVRRALGEQPPPLEEAYAVALDRLQAIDGPHLHCMALPGGCSGDLAGLVRRALDMAPVLGTEFELGE